MLLKLYKFFYNTRSSLFRSRITRAISRTYIIITSDEEKNAEEGRIMARKLFEALSTHRKRFLLLFFLILNSVAWFYLIIVVTGYAEPELFPSASSLLWLFYLATLVSMLIGPIIAEKFGRMRFIRFWIILGIVSSLFPLVLPTFGEFEVATLLIFWGFAFGIGFPSCLALIPLLTSVEKRGRTGGTIFLATYVVLFLLIVIAPLDIFSISLMLAVWRSLGLGIFLLHIKIDDVTKLRSVSYLSILRRRKFLLYFLPWLAFCLVNYSGVQILEQSFGQSMTTLILTMEVSAGALFCLISGWLMDLKGRKLVIIIGLVMLGLGYALLSFFPPSSFVQAFFIIVDSIAFGIFTVAFGFVIFGDMSIGERGEKFYALGNICVPAAVIVSLALSPWLKMIDISSAFSIASFFIFLAIIPLFFAPELLPEKVIKKMEIRRYAEEAKKVARR